MHRTNRIKLRSVVAFAAILGISACREGPLDVKNKNQPSVPQSAKEVETFVSKIMQQMWNGNQGATGNVGVQMSVMSLESHSALANFGMGSRAAIPRGTISNALGNSTQSENFRDFDHFTRNGRSVANLIGSLQSYIKAGGSTGTVQTDRRALSFGFYNLGYSLAYVSMIYDSAAILTPGLAADEIPPLSASTAVMAVAIQMLDSAELYGSNMATIPSEWVSGTAIPSARWLQVIRSHRARFRAGIARNPTQRAAVDWSKVIADATSGITSDFVINYNNSLGWAAGWRSQFATEATWAQMTPFVLGMADTARLYDAWLATPLTSRTPFLMRTPDLRFPSGETRTAQQAFTGTSRSGPPSGCATTVTAARCSILYFRNRPAGDDSPAEPWGNWFYDNWRFWDVRASLTGISPIVEMSVTENDMLAAEGYIRAGNVAAAATLIDKTRVRSGLAPVTGMTSLTAEVPGGNACVPRVPQGPTFTTTACGTIFEAMKWEKRLETSFTGYGQWFFDSRGWGDLVRNTVLEWPVPWQELSARLNLNFYTTSNSRAAAGTYGF